VFLQFNFFLQFSVVSKTTAGFGVVQTSLNRAGRDELSGGERGSITGFERDGRNKRKVSCTTQKGSVDRNMLERDLQMRTDIRSAAVSKGQGKVSKVFEIGSD